MICRLSRRGPQQQLTCLVITTHSLTAHKLPALPVRVRLSTTLVGHRYCRSFWPRKLVDVTDKSVQRCGLTTPPGRIVTTLGPTEPGCCGTNNPIPIQTFTYNIVLIEATMAVLPKRGGGTESE